MLMAEAERLIRVHSVTSGFASLMITLSIMNGDLDTAEVWLTAFGY